MPPGSLVYPKISIITPSFNQGAFVEQTIKSVLNQSYQNIEYIVIDGGSSDGTPEVIQRYADRLAYWVSEKDNGQTDALNKGFRRASGDVVAYLNSDDLYEPEALCRVAQEFRQNRDCRWMAGDCVFFNADGEQLMRPTIPETRWPWLRHWVISQPSVFWRRSLFDEYGFFDERLHFCMDYEYWLRLRWGGERCMPCSSVLSRFRLHESSKTVASPQGFGPEAAAIRKRYRKRLSRAETNELLRMERVELAEQCEQRSALAVAAWERGQLLRGTRHFLGAAKLQPSWVVSPSCRRVLRRFATALLPSNR